MFNLPAHCTVCELATLSCYQTWSEQAAAELGTWHIFFPSTQVAHCVCVFVFCHSTVSSGTLSRHTAADVFTLHTTYQLPRAETSWNSRELSWIWCMEGIILSLPLWWEKVISVVWELPQLYVSVMYLMWDVCREECV